MIRSVFLAAAAALVCGACPAAQPDAAPAPADWPTYRGDAARTGYTPDPLPSRLSLLWVHRPALAPCPAWPRSQRIRDDRAYQVAVAAGKGSCAADTAAGGPMVYFGSSADCCVYALNAATGRVAWSFVTGAPVRYAPAAWTPPDGGADAARVLAVSDDGFLYCLDAATGRLIWKRRGGPDDRMLLGNGRMTSRWPARGGPVVVGDTVYFGAGIWPSEGVWVYALDVRQGKVLWCNEEAAGLRIPQPHPGAWADSGIAAQGYLAAVGDQLFVPTGRAVPAALTRRDGTLQYFHLQRQGKLGGSAVALVGGFLLNSDAVLDARSGLALFPGVPTLSAAAGGPGWLAFRAEGRVCAVDLGAAMTTREVVRGGRKVKVLAPNVKWSVPTEAGGGSLIVAGRRIVSGGAGEVVGVDMDAQKVTWSLSVEGEALGLAAAGGRLYVSTDRGAIYCFGAGGGDEGAGGKAAASPATRPAAPTDAYGNDAAVAAAAKAILDKTNRREGYCAVLGCGDGRLAYELARQSKLHVYAVDADAANVAAARRKLLAAGLYGVRVTVHQSDPAATPYPNYFADLAVCGKIGTATIFPAGKTVIVPVLRLLRPGTGVACVVGAEGLTCTTRPALAGAGSWTHQYADAGNTLCGDDRLVRGPLGMLWYDGPDLHLPNRHGRGPAPLCDGSRLIVQGTDGLRALDIYNGRLLWEYPLPGMLKPLDQEHIMGTAGTGSNSCLGRRSLRDAGRVFVHAGERCVVLDAATGRKLAEHTTPRLPDGSPGRWGHIAFMATELGEVLATPSQGAGLLLGTLVNEEHLVPYRFLKADMHGMFTESRVLFALDAASGREQWRYVAEKSIRHNAIAVGGGRVYVIDREAAQETPGQRPLVKPHPPGTLLALDAATGKVVWKDADGIYGTMLAVSDAHDVLLMAYQSSRFQLNSEAGGRMTGFRAGTGERLWEVRARYASRPLINGCTIYAQPYAWDLLSGGQKMVRVEGETDPWTFRRSYGCGIISGAASLLLFRSATLGYRDLLEDRPTANYGGIRPGCWVNVIPAGGLVLMPDATTKCTCSYLNTATVALEPLGCWAPRIDPPGGGSPQAVRVTLSPPPRGAEVRYTLDGTAPGLEAALYDGPVTVAQAARLRARVFRDGQPVSPLARADFTIDPLLLPMGAEHWEVWDAPGAVSAPSRWTLRGDTVTQWSNIFTGSAGPAKTDQPRYGTLRILRHAPAGGDGTLSLQVQSEDDDMLGVAFRFQDPRRHYLWAMDRQRGLHVLICRNGDTYKVLASANKSYTMGKWYEVKVVLAGPRITVWLDGQKDLEAADAAFARGTVALHVWGNVGTSFRALRWAP